jgi:hypothetical protein
MRLIRAFCEGGRFSPHARVEMEPEPHLLLDRCPVKECGNIITRERAYRAVPAAYRSLMDCWFGGVLADWIDIGAIDVIDVGLFDLQVEYPRRDQVA